MKNGLDALTPTPLTERVVPSLRAERFVGSADADDAVEAVARRLHSIGVRFQQSFASWTIVVVAVVAVVVVAALTVVAVATVVAVVTGTVEMCSRLADVSGTVDDCCMAHDYRRTVVVAEPSDHQEVGKTNEDPKMIGVAARIVGAGEIAVVEEIVVVVRVEVSVDLTLHLAGDAADVQSRNYRNVEEAVLRIQAVEGVVVVAAAVVAAAAAAAAVVVVKVVVAPVFAVIESLQQPWLHPLPSSSRTSPHTSSFLHHSRSHTDSAYS